MDLLVIDLEHGDVDLEPFFLGCLGLDEREDLLGDDGDDASVGAIADHRVAFAGAGLAVGEETAMVAVEGVLEDLLADFGVDKLLVCVFGGSGGQVAVGEHLVLGVRPEGVVKGEFPGLALFGLQDCLVFDHFHTQLGV